jgi:hypothetical protein
MEEAELPKARDDLGLLEKDFDDAATRLSRAAMLRQSKSGHNSI